MSAKIIIIMKVMMMTGITLRHNLISAKMMMIMITMIAIMIDNDLSAKTKGGEKCVYCDPLLRTCILRHHRHHHDIHSTHDDAYDDDDNVDDDAVSIANYDKDDDEEDLAKAKDCSTFPNPYSSVWHRSHNL